VLISIHDYIVECQVPEPIAYDDELLAIEMTVVTRPFVLDFGGAFLDHLPGFSEEVLAEWRATVDPLTGTVPKVGRSAAGFENELESTWS
jgi:hypothetical protein